MYFLCLIKVTFSPELPEEVRGDQFETATPMHLNEVIQDEHEEQPVTSFDYAIEIQTEETPTEEPSDKYAPPTEIYSDAFVEIDISSISNEWEEVKTQEPGDQSVVGTDTTTPYTLLVTSTAATTPSHQELPRSTQLSPVTSKLESHEDMEGSRAHGTDDTAEATVEGSGEEAVQTTLPPKGPSIVITDETEIGGIEPTTLVPKTTPPEATTKSQIEDLEGSASGEDEASGDDTYPTESPMFESTVPPVHSTPHSQQPQSPAAEVTAVAPVLSPDGDVATESGSGADQLSGQEEASGQEEQSGAGLIQEVIVTVLPDATTMAAEEQSTLTADILGMPLESSTAVYSTRLTFTATEKTHTSLSFEHTPTTPEDHTSQSPEVYTSPAQHSTVTSKPHVDQLSGEGEASGQQESVVDLTEEVIVTALPEVAAVTEEGQTTLKANTAGVSSESSTAAHSTRPSFAATEEKQTSFTTERVPTTPKEPTSPSSEVYAAQAESDAASKPHDRHTTFSTTLPLHTFNHSTLLVPERVAILNEATTPLPDDYVDYDKEVDPSLVESVPQINEETAATEEPGRDSDSNYSVEGSTVNIRGT